ncbi:MAG: hypothetical protein PF572_02290 [Patescibacteria group bacterium]|jgi:hypothetical protein|nr:hypothetical protein [Patescibacteria group bacterium]
MPSKQLIGIKQDNLIDNSVVDELFDNLAVDALSGQADAQVSDGSQFSVGEMIIVYDGEDTFETAVIQSISVNTLTMTANLAYSYPLGSLIGKYLGVLDTGNNKYTRALAPNLGDGSDGVFVSSGNVTWSSEKNFSSVLIQNGHTVTVSGNFEIKCQGAFEIELGGKLTAKGRGHAGGGGGNYGSSGAGNGGGSVYQLKNTGHGGGGAGVASGTNAAGGGGGGYGSNGGSGSYSYYSSDRGIGGIPYNNAAIDDKSIAYLKGSGGGGGGSALSNSGSGATGGGIIRISCKNFVMAGEVDCDGNNGSNGSTTNYKTAGGGGGAGGTIFIVCLLGATMGANIIHARGGIGGQGYNGSNFGYYPGGNGGNGRIRIEAGAISGTSSPTLATGYSSGADGRTKYGWYFIKNIETENETINVNCYVEQNIVEKKNLASLANADQVDVEISDALQFEVGDNVLIRENEKLEIKTIDNIVGNILTMGSDLKYSYTTLAEVLRIDVQGIISLVEAGENESLQDMVIKDIEDKGNDVYKFSFVKCIKNNAEESGGMKLVGVVRLKGRNTGETVDVSFNEVSWMWF